MTSEWTDHGEILPPSVVEDFRIVREGDFFIAYFVHGPDFQHLHLGQARAGGPAGPVGPVGPLHPLHPLTQSTSHTRLYSGRIDDRRRIITAVWPGLPGAALWLFTEAPFGMIKQLLVAPKPGTGYAVAAANPAAIKLPDGTIEIFFEGRDHVVPWNIFRATWDGGTPVVHDEPFLRDAANPSLVVHDGRLYLYYSAHVGALFSTRAMSRPL